MKKHILTQNRFETLAFPSLLVSDTGVKNNVLRATIAAIMPL